MKMAIQLSDFADLPLGEQDERTHIKTRNLKARIGDPLQSDFKPQLKFSCWDDECSVAIDLNGLDTPTKLSGVLPAVSVRNQLPRFTVPASDNSISHDIYVKDNGDLEWDIILPVKPASNVFRFKIDTKNLDWFYQAPDLSEEEIGYGVPERADNVKGSYAVYHKTKRDNFKRLDGTEEHYQTGKAFHLYRPQAFDSKNKTEWCELHVDEVAGILTVTVPQKFLDTAVYPVTIDPDFGYTTAGASGPATIQDAAAHLLNTHTTGSSPAEEITEFHSYCSRDAAAGTYETAMAVYDVSSSLPNNRTHAETSMGSPGTSAAWQNVTGLSLALSASTEYCAALGEASGSDPCYFWYDTGSSGDQSVNTGMLTSSWSQRFSSSWKRSFYATAEEVAGGTTVTPDPVSAASAVVDPTVIKGSLTIAPTVVSAGSAVVDPSTIKGSLAITPSPVSALTAVVDPTVVLGGNALITPGAVSAGTAIVDPTVVLGSVAITPSAVSAGSAVVDPVVVKGSVTITPSAVSAGSAVVDPTIDISGGDVVVTPGAVSAGTAIVDPTVVKGSVTITPGVVSAASAVVDPTVLTTAGDVINVWARVNGVDVPNSNVTMTVNELTTMSFKHTIELNAGDYYELMFAVNNTNVKLDARSATGTNPAAPSVVLNVRKL